MEDRYEHIIKKYLEEQETADKEAKEQYKFYVKKYGVEFYEQ